MLPYTKTVEIPMPAARTAYDEFAYPSQVFPQTHPNRLAVIGTLLGLTPAPPARCRVLEIGCGDAGNLIALAYGSPEARFVGFDLATSAIEQGQSLAQEIGLKNIELFQADLMEYEPAEPFDYIIAHGFLSWVPSPVQERLLAVCRRALAPKGIAFISYNTYPGFHARRMLREMMLFHSAGAANPREKIDRSRGLLHLLLQGVPRNDEFAALVRSEAQWVLNRDSEAVLYHDDLAELNVPFYFHQFAGFAAHHGLQFLAEADFYEMSDRLFPSAVAEAIRKLPNIVLREQYLDFLKCRRFRQTLLVLDDVAIDREPKAERVRAMMVATVAKPESERVDLSPGVIEAFAGPRGGAMKVDHALTKAAMLVLHSTWPRPVPFAELVSAAKELIGGAEGEHEMVLAEVLHGAHATGLVELHLHRPHWVTAVSERPVASPLLRAQVRRGEYRVISLRPVNMLVDIPLYRALFLLLDGTRDRAALERELAQKVEDREILLAKDQKPAALPRLIEEGLHKAATEATLIA
jgi:SAM-dependent methyltransferase